MNGTAINIERACQITGLSKDQIIELIRNKTIFGERGLDGVIRISEAAIPILREEKARLIRRRRSSRHSRASPGGVARG